MSPKLFIGLAATAVLSLIVAIISHGATNTWTSGAVKGVKLFPDLTATAPKAATIKLTQGETTVTLNRSGTTWTMKDRGNFAVNIEKIKRLMVRLAAAELIEPKTNLAERYKLLELENPTGTKAKSRLLHIADEKGNTLAEVVMGKRRYDAFGTGKSGTYIRKPGDARTWLVNAALDADVKVAYWAKSAIVYDSERKNIKRITVEFPGVKEPLVITAKENRKDDQSWDLVNMPADKKIKESAPLDSIANGFTRINLTDVRPIAKAPSGPGLIKAKLEETDGLTVNFVIRVEKKAHWMTLSATGEGKKSKERADKINKQVKGWEYRISDSKTEQILKKRSDILEAKPVPKTKPKAPQPNAP